MDREKTDGQQEEEPVRSSREDVDLNGNSSLNDHQQLLTTASPTDVPPRRAVEPAAPAVKGATCSLVDNKRNLIIIYFCSRYHKKLRKTSRYEFRRSRSPEEKGNIF